jgi:hypothetical protein
MVQINTVMILLEQLGEDNRVFKPANCDGKLSVSDHHALFTAFQVIRRIFPQNPLCMAPE